MEELTKKKMEMHVFHISSMERQTNMRTDNGRADRKEDEETDQHEDRQWKS